jgi:uncharacterized protein YggT (Ycf19 family)
MFTTRFTVGIINFFLTIAEIFLGLRFIFRFFAANPNNGFVNWIYNSSDTLMEPFRGIFPPVTFGNHFVVDFSILFAMAIYGVFALLLIYIVSLIGAGSSKAVKASKKKHD